MYIGPNRKFLHYPLRKNMLMNVVAISRQPLWEQEGWAISANVGELLELHQDFHPLVLGMIGAISLRRCSSGGCVTGIRWNNGRQGVCLRSVTQRSLLRPFWVRARSWQSRIGRCFAQATSFEDALLRYERARKHRANAVQIQSRERANALQSSNLEHLGPGRSADDLGLFGYDPTTVQSDRWLLA